MSVFGLPVAMPGGKGITEAVLNLFGIYTPEGYGAKGGGVVNDTAHIVAFEAARKAANGSLWLRSVYGVNATIALTGSVYWTGKSGSGLVALAGFTGDAMVTSNNVTGVPSLMRGITFDCARRVNYAFLAESDDGSYHENCVYANALITGMRSGNTLTPVVLSAVTQTGAGPACTVQMTDPTYLCGVTALQALVVKCTDPGPAGTAKFLLSEDGGVTYPTNPASKQTFFAVTPIALPGGSNWLTTIGIQITKVGGADFVANTTYAFHVSSAGGSTTDISLNNNRFFHKCRAINCGTVYATAGLAGGYTQQNVVIVTGTVTTVAGSNVIQGDNNTHFLSMPGLREGEIMRIAGVNDTEHPQGVPFKVSAVLGDQLLIVDWTAPPNTAVAGAGFAIQVGWGAAIDCQVFQQFNHQFDQFEVLPPTAGGIRHGGLGEVTLNNPRVDYAAIRAFSVGTTFAD